MAWVAADRSSWRSMAVRRGLVSDAEGRYRRGLRHWRARTRLIIAVCLGPFIALGLVGLMIEGHAAAWIAGVVFGLRSAPES